MKEKPIQHDVLMEQFMISAPVIRQAQNLPPEFVEHHLNMLAAYGIVGQSLNELLKIDKQEWLKMLDRMQNNERGYK